MEDLIKALEDKLNFVENNIKQSNIPNPKQLKKFMTDLSLACQQHFNGIKDKEQLGKVSEALRTDFLFIGWDVKKNAPVPQSKAPTINEIAKFLQHAIDHIIAIMATNTQKPAAQALKVRSSIFAAHVAFTKSGGF
eukprot:SAG11_NODE_4550_length_1854_cov_2.067806_2_plen_136_part_00